MDGDEGFDELSTSASDAPELDLLRAKAFHFDRLMPHFQRCRQNELALTQQVAELNERVRQLETRPSCDCLRVSVGADGDRPSAPTPAVDAHEHNAAAVDNGPSPPAARSPVTLDNVKADGEGGGHAEQESTAADQSPCTSGDTKPSVPKRKRALGEQLRSALATLASGGERRNLEFVRMAAVAIFKRQEDEREH